MRVDRVNDRAVPRFSHTGYYFTTVRIELVMLNNRLKLDQEIGIEIVGLCCVDIFDCEPAECFFGIPEVQYYAVRERAIDLLECRGITIAWRSLIVWNRNCARQLQIFGGH